jgi:hypothetical protein
MVFPIVAPIDPTRTMIWTNLNLHYIRKLSCRYDLFWLSGSWEDSSMTPLHFCIFVIISSLKRICPLFQQFWISFTQGWFVQSLIKIGLLVLEKICFQYKNMFNMVFPIMALPNPRRPRFEQTWIYDMSESLHVNMTCSGPVVLEKISKWPIQFLYFCDYLPFEEILALYLNNSKFPLPKDALYKVWLKLACWFLRIFISISKHVDMVFPFVAPFDPQGQ